MSQFNYTNLNTKEILYINFWFSFNEPKMKIQCPLQLHRLFPWTFALVGVRKWIHEVTKKTLQIHHMVLKKRSQSKKG
jgi:hypothetical protein